MGNDKKIRFGMRLALKKYSKRQLSQWMASTSPKKKDKEKKRESLAKDRNQQLFVKKKFKKSVLCVKYGLKGTNHEGKRCRQRSSRHWSLGGAQHLGELEKKKK